MAKLASLISPAQRSALAYWLSPLVVHLVCLAGCATKRPSPPPAVSENIGTEPGQSAFYCKETAHPLVTGEEAPDTWTQRTLPTFTPREYRSPLSWQASANGHSYTPGEGTSELALTVLSTSDAEVVLRQPASRDPARGIPADITRESLGCVDTLRVLAEATLASNDGMLNETVSLPLEAQPSGIWIGHVDLATDALTGQFSASLALPAGFSADEPVTLRAALGLRDETLVGDLEVLSGELRDPTGDNRHPGVGERLAHFPSRNQCGSEYDTVTPRQLEQRTAVAVALAKLNGVGTASLIAEEELSPEGELTFFFEFADTTICQPSPNEVSEVLLTRAEMKLVTADSSIEGNVATDVVILHEPERVVASATLLIQQEGPKLEVTNLFGIKHDLLLEDYAAAVAELTVGITPETNWGTLEVFGLGAIACSTEPDAGLTERPDAGASAVSVDHCERRRVWAVRWGQPPN